MTTTSSTSVRPYLIAFIGGVTALVATIVLIGASRGWAEPIPIAGDPQIYGQIYDVLMPGSLPYGEAVVEHLPVMLVPIVGVGFVAALADVSFAAIWPLIAIIAALTSVAIAGRVALPDYQMRYTIAILPMLPLVIYRLEIFTVMLALAAIVAYQNERMRSGTLWTILGPLAKGWPVVLLVIPFRRGRQRLALVGAAIIGTLNVVIWVTPGSGCGSGIRRQRSWSLMLHHRLSTSRRNLPV
ncbi:hypothetical protein ACFLQ7_01565 [Actinomycetota bacterium]